MKETKEPLTNIEVTLIGEDGNAFSIIARVSRALRKAGYKKFSEDFQREATSGDYDNLLMACHKYVIVL